MGLGAPDLLINLAVILLLFGSTKLPKLARSIGEASKEFKKGVNDGDRNVPEVAPAPPVDDKVTMSRAEYDALLAEREATARKDAPPSA